MSLGIGGWAELAAEDDTYAVYCYAPSNLNNPACYNREKILDGMIQIKKSSLLEPEIHEKIKHLPHGKKKKIIKRIRVSPDFDQLLAAEDIVVENSTFCWITADNGYDLMALRLIYKIYSDYQDEGALPQKVSMYM